MKKIEVYDTTLRDGSQAEKVSFSLADKLHFVHKADEFRLDYLEGGWPGSNEKDEEFFRAARALTLGHSRIAAFGSTRRAGVEAPRDTNLQKLLGAETEVITIFGKTWDLHTKMVLKVSAAENIDLIAESISFLKERGRRVFFDAEHFFDGYRNNERFALDCLEAAEQAGAELIVLCDTNGGALPGEINAATARVRERVKIPLGIHTHNDSGLAVANTLAAVNAGATHVQGTINGLGERCGNTDLMVALPLLQCKMGRECLPPEKISHLTGFSRYVYELSNLTPVNSQPFVGASAFAHKGGVHADAVLKEPRSYEHIDPALVGNERRILISELAGGSSILSRLGRYGIVRKGEETKKILELVTRREREGYQFEAAEASFELMVAGVLGKRPSFFELLEFRAIVEHKKGLLVSEASVKVRVGGQVEHTIAEGNGPVNALDAALRKGLLGFFPCLGEIRLVDFKVRVLNPETATAARVRVLVETSDHEQSWGTIGLSENIIEASVNALVDSIDYKLLKDARPGKNAPGGNN